MLSSIAIILMGKKELVALLNLPSWCLVMVEWLFLAVPWGCLRFVIAVFLDHSIFHSTQVFTLITCFVISSISLNIFYSINTNDIQHTYIVNIQRIRTKA